MEKIIRGSGFTHSERFLQALSDRTFLRLWTYPNTFSDRGKKGAGDGKEICDLLVVCGDDVIIFSDKSVEWPNGKTPELPWTRWYRRAIRNSVDQIRGAERWLRDYPDRVFIDPGCARRLPLDLPPLERRRVHGIAVARGAHDASSQPSEGIEQLFIRPDLRGGDHEHVTDATWQPFAIGDVDPGGPFVHVLDEVALECLMGELDTITDFVDYLLARATAIRERHFAAASGEADLLACYLRIEDHRNRPRFMEARAGENRDAAIVIWPGAYELLITTETYKAKKRADAASYVWDRLIDRFVGNVMAGTSISLWGETPSASLAEPALRIMARERRLRRRMLGSALSEMLTKAAALPENRLARFTLPGEGRGGESELAYVFMTLAPLAGVERDEYRKARSSMLQTYCLALLQDHRKVKRVVGIGLDKPGGPWGTSEDLMVIEPSEWTEEMESDVSRRRSIHKVMLSGRMTVRRQRGYEFPPGEFGNRQQRRSAERAARKSARRTQANHPP